MLGLRHFTMLCNIAEYKMMDQDVSPVACTINVYDRRFYNCKLHSSLECKLQPYDRNPSYG
jgi:hypothetical protein